ASPPRGADDVVATSGFRHGGQDWRFSVCPRRDLFCIQPLDLATVDWKLVFCGVPLAPLGRGLPPPPPPRHVALEFDPGCIGPSATWYAAMAGLPADVTTRWREMCKDRGFVGCLTRAMEAQNDNGAGDVQIWLIDYAIR